MGPCRAGDDREDDLGGREGNHQQINLKIYFNTNTNTNTKMEGDHLQKEIYESLKSWVPEEAFDFLDLFLPSGAQAVWPIQTKS